MRHVGIHANVPSAGAMAVFTRLADFARYPDFTDAVREVIVTLSNDGSIDSRWAVNFRNGVLRWAERDIVDPSLLRITFAQTDGDFDRFDGVWQLEQIGEDVLIRFEAEFDLGMPSLAPIIDPIAERALVENIERILTGLTGPATTFEAVPVALCATTARTLP